MTNMQELVVIELYGLAGSGKSTLLKKLIKTGQYESLETAAVRGFIASTYLPRILQPIIRLCPVQLLEYIGIKKIMYRYRARILSQHAAVSTDFLTCVHTILADGTLSPVEQCLFLDRFLTACTYWTLAQQTTPRRPLVADEFFLQKVYPLCKTPNAVATYITHAPKPHVAITLPVSPEVAAERLRNRPTARQVTVGALSDEQLRQRLNQGVQVFTHVTRELAAAHIPVISPAETADTTTTLHTLKKHLNDHV